MNLPENDNLPSNLLNPWQSIPQKYVVGLSEEAQFNGRKATYSSFLDIREDENGNKKKHTEIMKRHQPPNVTAIFGAYNRFDKDYKKDAAYYELKKQELEVRKALAKDKVFDFDL